jgi:hypothetical protein
MEERLKQKHICIRIFEDDIVMLTDENNNELEVCPPDKDERLGPKNTYDQAFWYSGSPICIWYRGKRRCR